MSPPTQPKNGSEFRAMRSLPVLVPLTLVAALALGGCQTTRDQGSAAAQTVVAPAAEPQIPFDQWLADFRRDALAQGIRAATLDRAFANVKLSDRVVELDRSQPEFNRQVWQYLDTAVSDDRVRDGRAKSAANAAILAKVSRSSGVPAEILVAFWGIETDYGVAPGNFSVINSLTTLAYEGRRAKYFRDELIAALRILEAGDVPPERMTGSWAGAMGQTQFMPTIFLKYAVDEDHDGKRNIWTSSADVFASTALFVLGNGWRPGESWGGEVTLPADFPFDQAELTVTKPVSEWARMGVRSFDGTPLSGTDSASILTLAGKAGPAFLVRENYRAIMRYNPSTSYALAVAVLSDRLAGRPGIRGGWPRSERALTGDERRELQQRLTDRGYTPGTVDGIVGAQTRDAVRRFQKEVGEVPDGFATVALLERLRAAPAR